MLAIFDNDGTLCDTQEVESHCYAEAIQRVTAHQLATLDWSTYAEPTATAIVRALLGDDPQAANKEAAIKDEFLRLLKQAQPRYPGDFSPLPGAIAFLTRLQQEQSCAVAIATGCFAASARFKLRCCGLALDAFPHATSCDTPRRIDIIDLAARRAGHDLNHAVHFGDGSWDVIACRTLGLRFIGIGRHHASLRSLGAQHTFRDYSEPELIIAALRDARPPLASAS